MSKAMNLAKLLDASGDVSVGALDNVPPSNDASALTTGTLPVDRVPYVGRRNLIINGGFDVWQRGTSFPNINGEVNIADRFWAWGGADLAAAKSSDAPNGFASSLRLYGNTAAFFIGQRVEAINSVKLKSASTATISFYAKTANSGNLTVAIRIPDSTDSWGSYTQTLLTSSLAKSSTWTKYEVSFDTASYALERGLTVCIVDNSVATSDIYITGVQLELGSVATPFEHRSYGEELALCQRYYYKSDDIHCGQSGSAVSAGYSTYFSHSWTLPVTMRAYPTVLQHITVTSNDTGIQTSVVTANSYSYNHGNMGGNYSYWGGQFILEAEL